MSRPLLFAFALSSFTLATTYGQPLPVGVTPERKPLFKAALEGVISDIFGKAVAGAKVTVGNESTVTGPPGSYHLEISVPDTGGIFRANVEAESYRSKSASVKLMSRDTSFHNFVLVPIKLKMNLTVRFKPKRLTIENTGYLDMVIAPLKDNPEWKIEIQGHCFEWDSKRRNLRISQARADAVRRFIIRKGGIDSSQVVAKGYGSSAPLMGDKYPVKRQYNTRIEVHSLN